MIVDNLPAILALVVGLVAMALGLRRPPMTIATVPDYRREIDDLKATVNTLRRALDEKDRRIGMLERDLETAKQRLASLEQSEATRDNNVIVAVLGTDEALQIDLAMLRNVSNRTGLRLTRLLPVTKTSLAAYLSRHRTQGRPVRYVHFAVHSSPAGLVFSDGVADGVWLSETLADVQVVLIAGCQSDAVGDLIGVVPAVVSMREDVGHRDAASFALVFWTAVGNGSSPEAAYDLALDRVPAVAEYAELHI
jgi:hypothetical protein